MYEKNYTRGMQQSFVNAKKKTIHNYNHVKKIINNYMKKLRSPLLILSLSSIPRSSTNIVCSIYKLTVLSISHRFVCIHC